MIRNTIEFAMETQSDRLKRAIEIAGYKSAADFARTHDLVEVTLRSHVNGTRGFNAGTAAVYGGLLDVRAAWLLTGEGDANTGGFAESMHDSFLFEVNMRSEPFGLSEQELCIRAGVDADTIENVRRGNPFLPALETMEKLAAVLECHARDLMGETSKWRQMRRDKLAEGGTKPIGMLSGATPLAEFTQSPNVEVPVPTQHPRNLPVRGTTVGGDEGDFTFNGDEVDFIPRLPSLSGVKEAFALYITGDSMFPRFEHGDTAIVHPGRSVEPGKDVIVELHGQDGEPGACYLKRLVRRSGGKMILRQFNPDAEIEIDANRVKAIFRVLNLSELL